MDLKTRCFATIALSLLSATATTPANLKPHPDDDASRIARRGGPGHDDGASLRLKIARRHKVEGEDIWHGFRRVKFSFDGRRAWIVEPSVAARNGMPWTWTMQWAEFQPDRTGVHDLLRRGWHHATIDLFDTRMDESGLKAAARFQEFLVKELGLAPKADLVGISWGGFFSVRYVAANPQNVRRLYLDVPLLSFDGFKAASSEKGIGTWFRTRPADGVWRGDPRMPVNMAGAVAKAGIPILLFYGGSDTVVPPAENCLRFVKAFRAAKGEIEVHCRNEYAHHPVGTDPDKTGPIVRFFESGDVQADQKKK